MNADTDSRPSWIETLGRWIVRRRRTRSRGQALVEFAMFVPVIMMMVLGATDISTLLDNHLDVVYAARAGARVGSVIGNYSPTGAPYTVDCAVIGAVQSALSSTRLVKVQQIAIYKSDPTTGQYSSSLPQDVYPGNTVCNADGTTTPAATTTTWAPNTRSNTPFTEDSIGVAITYSYQYQFDLLGIGTFATTDYSVMPIEIVVSTPAPAATPTPK